MKNLNLLPTDQPSRLLLSNKGNLQFLKDNSSTNPNNHFNGIYQHIYITNNEVIKEGVDQWYLDKVLNEPYNSGGAQYSSKQDVIILTTDQDLIKDGVQAIDDEFLEWFVKNPSCESVETHIVKLCTNCGQQFCDNRDCRGYKDEPEYLISFPENTIKQIITYCKGYEISRENIIIPKEEPKFEDSIENSLSIMSIANDMFGKKEEPKQRLEKYSERFDNKDNEIVEGVFNPENWGKRLVKEEPKQLFTDHPISELGDKEFEEAPIRECELISYDDNKYCYVKVEGIEKEIKRCYIYPQKGRYGDVDCVSIEEIKELLEEEPKQECKCTDECLGYLTKECKRIEQPKSQYSTWQNLIEEVGSEEELIKIIKTDKKLSIMMREAMRNNCKQKKPKELPPLPYEYKPEDCLQETLEEVALRFLPHSEVEHDTDFITGFEFGAKWQQERSYSPEEVNFIIAEAWNSCEDNEGDETFTQARDRILRQCKPKQDYETKNKR